MRALLLAPLSWIYKLVVLLRHKFFDWGWLKSEEYDIPIVCVGNLTVGGTGKTPVSEFLIGHLSTSYNMALLSRGYKRKSKGFVEVETNSSYRQAGDEPKQIKLKFPHVVVAVCADRRAGISEIRRRHPEVNLIILDDGFQHRHVESWINILLMDYTRPIYCDSMLPLGSLRDVPSELHRAHFVLVTKCPDNMTPLDQRIVKKALGLFPYQSIYFTRMESMAPVPIHEEAQNMSFTGESSVIAMSGIGNPAPFHDFLKSRYKLAGELVFADHHAYRVSDLRTMADALKHAPPGSVIVTTEKDAVKLTNKKQIPEGLRKRLYYIPINVSFAGEDSEEEFLRKLEYNVRTNPKHSILHPQ